MTLPRGWRLECLGDIAEVYSGGTPNRSRPEFFGGQIPWVKSGELNQRFIFAADENLTDEGLASSSAKWVKAGSVLVAMYGATAGAVAWLGIDATINQAIAAVRAKDDGVDPAYLFLAMEHAIPHLLKNVQGSGQPNLNAGMIKSLALRLPPYDEQGRITAVNSLLQRQETVLAMSVRDKHRFRRALLQEVLTGRRRFKGFGMQEWRDAPLGEWFAEFSAVQGNGTPLEVLSCTKRGIVLQRHRFSKRMASRATHRYKVVRQGDFVYDPMLLWDGSMGFVDVADVGVVSPAYATLTFRGDESEKDYVSAVLDSQLVRHQFKVISQGTNQRRRKALPDDFLAIGCRVPAEAEERARIGELARLLDDEITRLKQLRAALGRQRRGVAESLLTGKVRIPA